MSKVKKIVALGAIGSGKSSLLKKLAGHPFVKEEVPTMGLRIHSLELGKKEMGKFVFWELTSAGKLESQPVDYLKGAHAAVYIFDLSRPSTYVDLYNEKKLLDKMMPGVPSLFIANKADLISAGQLEKILHQFEELELVAGSAKNDLSEELLLDKIKKLFS